MDWDDKYHAKLAIMAIGGDMTAMRTFNNCIGVHHEIAEYYTLAMDLSITYGSKKHHRLMELAEKWETAEVLNFQPF